MFSTEIYITEDDYSYMRIDISRADYDWHESVEYIFYVYPQYTTKEPEDIYYYDMDLGRVIVNQRRFALNIVCKICTVDGIFILNKQDTLALFDLFDLDYIIRESEPNETSMDSRH